MSDNTTIPRQLSIFDPIHVPLTKGKIALIDLVDADLSAFKWYCLRGKYAARELQSGKKISMHRIILERIIGHPLATSEICDHIDGNGLNNQRANLRVATPQQNNANKRGYSRSGYKGVYWVASRQRWYANIQVNHKSINLGRFRTPEEAHAAYCKAATEFFGEFARFR